MDHVATEGNREKKKQKKKKKKKKNKRAKEVVTTVGYHQRIPGAGTRKVQLLGMEELGRQGKGLNESLPRSGESTQD